MNASSFLKVADLCLTRTAGWAAWAFVSVALWPVVGAAVAVALAVCWVGICALGVVVLPTFLIAVALMLLSQIVLGLCWCAAAVASALLHGDLRWAQRLNQTARAWREVNSDLFERGMDLWVDDWLGAGVDHTERWLSSIVNLILTPSRLAHERVREPLMERSRQLTRELSDQLA